MTAPRRRRPNLTAHNRALHTGDRRYEDRAWMLDAYTKRKLSLRQMAAETGCGVRTIARWMIAHGIPTRSAEQAYAAHRQERAGQPAAAGNHGSAEATNVSRTYVVPGTVIRVIDGDSLSAELDLGWDITLGRASIRLAGIDCPEKATGAGKAAAAFTASMLPAGTPITVHSHSRDKYGRVLGSVDTPGGDLAAALLDAGHAHAYAGGARPMLADTATAVWAGVRADLAAERLAALDRLARAVGARRHRIQSAIDPAADQELDDAVAAAWTAVHGHPYPAPPGSLA